MTIFLNAIETSVTVLRSADGARLEGRKQPASAAMTEPKELTLDNIESLAVGAWILGTGGGGSPVSGAAPTCGGSL